jgi:hypothetical protein
VYQRKNLEMAWEMVQAKRLVSQRIADSRVLRLIEAMLQAGSYGKARLYPTERGTPQGARRTPKTGQL